MVCGFVYSCAYNKCKTGLVGRGGNEGNGKISVLLQPAIEDISIPYSNLDYWVIFFFAHVPTKSVDTIIDRAETAKCFAWGVVSGVLYTAGASCLHRFCYRSCRFPPEGMSMSRVGEEDGERLAYSIHSCSSYSGEFTPE